MVGLTIVSHSRDLARALMKMAQQMSAQSIPVSCAGGVGVERGELGTDATEIMEAIRAVWSEAGVLVLMDLGSALLSTDTALELLGNEIASHVRVCGASLVEGTVAAVVQISTGADLNTVYQEALEALEPKRLQLGEHPPGREAFSPVASVGTDTPGSQRRLVIGNPHGLHARPAAKFLEAAAAFQAEIMVTNLTTSKGPVTARSLNQLVGLGIGQNHELLITASGPEAPGALEALSKLVEGNFGEPAAPPITPLAGARGKAAGESVADKTDENQADTASPRGGNSSSKESRPASIVANGESSAVSSPIPLSPGYAVGPAFYLKKRLFSIPQTTATDREQEIGRLDAARNLVRKRISGRIARIGRQAGESAADIFNAHLLILDDPEIYQQTCALIRNQGYNAARAWDYCFHRLAEEYRSLDDQYLRQRSADLVDVEEQVLAELLGGPGKAAGPERAAIVIARDLTPSQTAGLDMSRVLGIVTQTGGKMSHSAILARALGIPAVVGHIKSSVKPGTPVALDGTLGRIIVNPSQEEKRQFSQAREQWQQQRAEAKSQARSSAVTTDGHQISILANAGDLATAGMAREYGAQGIGLLRTEFLFLTREQPPDEEEQVALLKQIITKCEGQPLVVRTLDIGGDKPLPYLPRSAETNPFLGVRGIRLSLTARSLFHTHLRAILRAGQGGNVQIMLPMIAQLEELRQARLLLIRAHASLSQEVLPHLWPIPLGIMVETPAAVLMAPELAREADFFSLGTNDLTQYIMAAERGNPQLREYADGLHPALLRAVDQVVHAARGRRISVSVCGELCAQPPAALVLLGLGVEKLSMAATSIPAVKAEIRKFSYQQMRSLAREALKQSTASQVRNLIAALSGHNTTP